MNFVIYDLIFLVVFSVFSAVILSLNRKKLEKEGSLILYKTQWGIKLINSVGKKYQKTLKFLSYVSILVGYVLMICIIWLIIQTVWVYLSTPIATAIRAPPLMPLIPYFPELFGLNSLFPPFYFTYFILVLLVVATVHEFSHGIFARRYRIKIKSTGFAFFKYFPAFFGAFVEQEEKDMNKRSKFEQMSVLSAGVFANVLTAILFGVLIIIFFNFAFASSGVIVSDYAYTTIGFSEISSINGNFLDNSSLENIFYEINKSELGELRINGQEYFGIKGVSSSSEVLGVYFDAPAINSNIVGAISKVNGIPISSKQSLSYELSKFSAGETILVETITSSGKKQAEVLLQENPYKNDSVWLGVLISNSNPSSLIGKFNSLVGMKEPGIYYEPVYEMSEFIYDFFWWMILINVAVALFNMLPLGILDGGRFFYLSLLSLTKSDKIAKRGFALATWFFIALFGILMIKWAFSFF